MALALKRKKKDRQVFVLVGDGELYEGSVWEAVMFAKEHKLDNLTMIIDYNKICMLDYCKNIIDLEPIDDKFRAFGWDVSRIDGHDMEAVYSSLSKLKAKKGGLPKVLVADTVKGKGVFLLENDSLCHVKVLKTEELDRIILEYKS